MSFSIIFAQDDGLVDVIVFGEVSGASIENIDIENWFSFGGFSAKVDLEDFESLRNNKNLKVFADHEYYASLDESVNYIGADEVWNLEVESTNLTGSGQTVCIIDTGVDYTHKALGGCFGENNVSSECKVIGGYDFVNDDSDPRDDNGHGTHVAGIVSSGNDIYKGVSPASKIIAIKVLDENGLGDAGGIISGIDWCTKNSEKFNISVISMSLADCSNHEEYCDSKSPFSYPIGLAVEKNVSVVVSSGNGKGPNCEAGSDFGLAEPACIQKVIAVGSVNLEEEIFYQRWNLFQVMAPGIKIKSSFLGGNYKDMSGTSMAVPHLSGTILLLDELTKIQEGRRLNVWEIKNLLNLTQREVYDSSTENFFPIINSLDVVFSAEKISPSVGLNYPSDSKLSLGGEENFSCSVSDWQLSNITLKIWEEGIEYFSLTKEMLEGGEIEFSLTNFSYGDYLWNCYSYDLNGNLGMTFENNSFFVGGVFVKLLGDSREEYTNFAGEEFSCSASSSLEHELWKTEFYLWDENGSLTFNEEKEIKGFENTSNFNYSFFEEGKYFWNCQVFNNDSKSYFAFENFSVSYDITSPEVYDFLVEAKSDSVIISWNSSEEVNSSFEEEFFKEGMGFGESSLVIDGLNPSTIYFYNFSFCDRARNCDSFDLLNFTTLDKVISNSGEGSSGGSGPSRIIKEGKAINISEDSLFIGQSLFVGKGDLLGFSFSLTNYSLKILEIRNVSVELFVAGEDIVLTRGGEIYLPLGESEAYLVYLRLDSFNDEGVDIFIKGVLNGKEDEEETGGFFATGNAVSDAGFNGGSRTGGFFSWLSLLGTMLFASVFMQKKLKGEKLSVIEEGDLEHWQW